jgi:hypothetical protein
VSTRKVPVEEVAQADVERGKKPWCESCAAAVVVFAEIS